MQQVLLLPSAWKRAVSGKPAFKHLGKGGLKARGGYCAFKPMAYALAASDLGKGVANRPPEEKEAVRAGNGVVYRNFSYGYA